MEYTPILTGTAVGVGMGLVDKSSKYGADTSHQQLIYRGGGLLASLFAQYKGWGPANVAPAAVAAFATHFAARAVGLMVTGEGFGKFGAVYPGPPNVQHLTGITDAGMTRSGAVCRGCGQAH